MSDINFDTLPWLKLQQMAEEEYYREHYELARFLRALDPDADEDAGISEVKS
jgi:hypothetical protein